MTEPSAAQLKAAQHAIASFDYGDYGLDEVASLVEDNRERQDWIRHLAYAVAKAVLTEQGKRPS